MELEKKYKDKIEKAYDLDTNHEKIEASVIVIIYHPDREEFKELLDSLDDQTTKKFQTIIIDNGSDWSVKELIEKYESPSRYVVLEKNYGLTIGRNIGAELSEGEILIFLDDDGVPRKDFVEEHLKAHRKHEIVALRGRIIPKSEDIFSRLSYHYDIGDEPYPYIIDTEGNSSFNKKELMKVGGFNEGLKGSGGHEGVEVTYRLLKSGIDKEKIIYYPDAVIYHDYISGIDEFLRRKIIRQKKQENLLKEEHPKLFEFEKSYEPKTERPQIRPSENVKLMLIRAISSLALFLWAHLRGEENRDQSLS